MRIPALSEGWKGSFKSLLEEADRPPSGTAWEGFRPLTVTAVARESSIITSYTLSPASGSAAGPPRQASTSPSGCDRRDPISPR